MYITFGLDMSVVSAAKKQQLRSGLLDQRMTFGTNYQNKSQSSLEMIMPVRARRHPHFLLEQAGEIGNAREANGQRGLGNVGARSQQRFGLLQPVAIEILHRRDAHFFVETAGQVAFAQRKLTRHLLPRERFHVMLVGISHRFADDPLHFRPESGCAGEG